MADANTAPADTAPAPAATPAPAPAGNPAPATGGNDPFGFPPSETPPAAENPPVVEQGQEEKPQETPFPEKYEFNLPEGLKLTDDIEKRFTEIAHDLKLTQEQANGLIKLHSDIMMDTMQKAAEQKNQMAQECHKAGLTAPANLQKAKLAINTFDETGEVMNVLVESGAAFHPAVQKMLQAMGSVLSEDTAPDNKPAAKAKSAADLLFGNSKY